MGSRQAQQGCGREAQRGPVRCACPLGSAGEEGCVPPPRTEAPAGWHFAIHPGSISRRRPSDDKEQSVTPKKSLLLTVFKRRARVTSHGPRGPHSKQSTRLGPEAEGPGRRGPEPALWFPREGTGKAQGPSHGESSARPRLSDSGGLWAPGVSLAPVTSGRGSAGLCASWLGRRTRLWALNGLLRIGKACLQGRCLLSPGITPFPSQPGQRPSLPSWQGPPRCDGIIKQGK